MNNVIFVPVGIPIAFHPAYDATNHWRITKPTRNYKVIAYTYNDFQPDFGPYDIRFQYRHHHKDL